MKQIAARYGILFIQIAVYVIIIHSVSAQNLILDPSAETDPIWNGWTQKSGNWQMGNYANDHVYPQSGVEYFYAGLASDREAGTDTSELYQDINVSSNAASINAGTAQYTFSGWMKVYAYKNDAANMVVEYRDVNGKVLSSYNTGVLEDLHPIYQSGDTSWHNYTNVTTAPPGTVDIRIRLISLFITGSDSDGYMDNLSLTVNTLLPVKLLTFDAKTYNDSVAVSWSTASEENNAYFTVERSADGSTWTDVKTIAGAGNSNSVINYLTYDNDPLPGTSYYRLKQTDVNGNTSFSSIVSVSFNGLDYQLFPNPTTTELHLKGLVAGSYTVNCYSLSGEAVSLPIQSESDVETAYTTSQLSSGLYVLLVHTSNKTITTRFIVR